MYTRYLIDDNNNYKNQEEVIKSLMEKYRKTSMIIKINSFKYKNNVDMFNEILQNVSGWLVDLLKSKILLKLYFVDIDGPQILMIINKEARDMKRLIVDVEEKHILGKCLNIKVFDYKHEEITRDDIGKEPLGCPLCSRPMGICDCSKKNNGEDMISYMREAYMDYKFNFSEHTLNY